MCVRIFWNKKIKKRKKQKKKETNKNCDFCLHSQQSGWINLQKFIVVFDTDCVLHLTRTQKWPLLFVLAMVAVQRKMMNVVTCTTIWTPLCILAVASMACQTWNVCSRTTILTLRCVLASDSVTCQSLDVRADTTIVAVGVVGCGWRMIVHFSCWLEVERIEKDRINSIKYRNCNFFSVCYLCVKMQWD